jgi:hypothetical protein
MIPKVWFPPATPFTLQLTAVFDVPDTVAVNCLVAVVLTVAEGGSMVMVIVGGAVTVAVAALEEAGAVPPQDVTAQTRPIKPANEIIDTHVPRIPISKTPRQSRDEEAGALVGRSGTIFREEREQPCSLGVVREIVAPIHPANG